MTAILLLAHHGFVTAVLVNNSSMARRSRILTFVFWAYWVCLTFATHAPTENAGYLHLLPGLGQLPADKLNHLVAYAALAFLAYLAFVTCRDLQRYSLRIIFVMLACWAMIDELTQPFFGRAADAVDWLYDCGGLTLGLGVGLLASQILFAKVYPLSRQARHTEL